MVFDLFQNLLLWYPQYINIYMYITSLNIFCRGKLFHFECCNNACVLYIYIAMGFKFYIHHISLIYVFNVYIYILFPNVHKAPHIVRACRRLVTIYIYTYIFRLIIYIYILFSKNIYITIYIALHTCTVHVCV